MKTALIGHTGFVGSNLATQTSFDIFFNSKNIETIKGQSFDLVVCSGIQAKKWWANEHPDEDLENIRRLLELLSTVKASRFVLISTVDVYPRPKGVDETTPIDSSSNHAYGKNRFEAEEFVRNQFPEHLIVRLPGLFGNGIKKNVIHDLLKRHELEKINPMGIFQYYYLKHLWKDIQKAQNHGIRLLNLATEAVSTDEIIGRFFPEIKVGPEQPFAANYDMRSIYADLWDSKVHGYLYGRESVLDDLASFITGYPTGDGTA